MKIKVERNLPCPCGRQQKYKHCCNGKVPWEDYFRKNDPRIPLNLTARGKNLAFLNIVGEALQLSRIDQGCSWPEIKKACTPEAIKKIYSSVNVLWPTEDDLLRIYEDERTEECGLYVGRYDVPSVIKGITRHSIYSDRILLFDPFCDARNVRPDFDPIEHPEKYRMNTLKWLRLWLTLQPWINAGLVELVPRPDHLNLHLFHEGIKVQTKKFDKNPRLAELRKEWVASMMQSDDSQDWATYNFLLKPDDKIISDYLLAHPGANQTEIDGLVRHIKRMRDQHPYFVEGATIKETKSSEIIMHSTGASYYIAKIVAVASGAHIITDIPTRWKEVELDREINGTDGGPWTSFAKAFQNTKLKVLDDVPLKAALTLREEGRLERLRTFLRTTWKVAKSAKEFSEENASALADELSERIAEADEEWKKIDRELLKWFGGEISVAASSLPLAEGKAGWAAGGLVLGGLANLGVAWLQRRTFPDRYPAAFFLNLPNSRST